MEQYRNVMHHHSIRPFGRPGVTPKYPPSMSGFGSGSDSFMVPPTHAMMLPGALAGRALVGVDGYVASDG